MSDLLAVQYLVLAGVLGFAVGTVVGTYAGYVRGLHRANTSWSGER